MAAKTQPKTRLKAAPKTEPAPPVMWTDMDTAHTTLQRLRDAARAEGRRSDAQRYADTQFLIREEMKLAHRRATKEGRLLRGAQPKQPCTKNS